MTFPESQAIYYIQMQTEEYNLPKQIPVMTLRGVVLFPKAMMPLRIFEERYKNMLNERLLDDRIFAIVCEREDVPAEEEHLERPFSVATAGLIRVSKENPDGTSFVLLQGLERVRILSVSQEVPYRIIDVEPMVTSIDTDSDKLRSTIIDELERNQKLGGDVSDEMLEFLSPLTDDTAFLDLAAYTLCKQTTRKQELLEEQSFSRRANMLIEDLTRENDRLKLINDALGRNDDKSMGFN